MITHNKYDPTPTDSKAATATPEQHHGDLRKGAYLKRRAAYQMQADSCSPRRSSTLTAKNRNPR